MSCPCKTQFSETKIGMRVVLESTKSRPKSSPHICRDRKRPCGGLLFSNSKAPFFWLDAIWSHSLCAASIFPAQEIVFQQPMNAMGGGEAQSWRAIGVRRVLTSAVLLLGWIYTCMCAQQCTMCTLESRVEPYAKRTIIYTEAPRHLKHLPIARYHIQICVYDTEAYSA